MKIMTILITLSMLYSTCARTLSWAQLRTALASHTLTDLSRTPEIEKTYQEFRISLKERNLTVPQHVKQNIFGFTGRPKEPMHFLTTTNINDMLLPVYVTGPENIWCEFIKRQMQPRAVAGIQEKSQFVLFAINDFPYSLTNINHWVVWSSFQFNPSIQEALLVQILDQNVERLSFQNPVGLKSIPEINHFQLFWRKKDGTMDEL